MIRLKCLQSYYTRQQTQWFSYLPQNADALQKKGNSYLVLKNKAKFKFEFEILDNNQNFAIVDIYPFIKSQTSRKVTEKLREKIKNAIISNQDKLYIDDNYGNYYNTVIEYDVNKIKNLDIVIMSCL